MVVIMEYTLEGFYRYNGSQGKLTGELDLNSQGFFESIITDHMSRVPEQTFRGRIQNTDSVSRLEFFKFPPNANLANLVYRLEKPITQDFSGRYTGQWGALPYKVEFNKDLGLLLARVDMSVCGIGDYAELNISKK